MMEGEPRGMEVERVAAGVEALTITRLRLGWGWFRPPLRIAVWYGPTMGARLRPENIREWLEAWSRGAPARMEDLWAIGESLIGRYSRAQRVDVECGSQGWTFQRVAWSADARGKSAGV